MPVGRRGVQLSGLSAIEPHPEGLSEPRISANSVTLFYMAHLVYTYIQKRATALYYVVYIQRSMILQQIFTHCGCGWIQKYYATLYHTLLCIIDSRSESECFLDWKQNWTQTNSRVLGAVIKFQFQLTTRERKHKERKKGRAVEPSVLTWTRYS